MATYYKPSNKFSFSGFPHFLASILFIVPLISVVYAYLTWYIPIIYLNLLISIGYGALVGYVMNQVVRMGKVRNTIIAVAFGLVAGVFALYCQWVVWLDLVINAGEKVGNHTIGITLSNISVNQTWALFQQPGMVWDLIKAVNEVGTWGIQSATVSGIFLSVIWVIEAGLILFFAVTLPWGRAGKPFCETGNDWAREVELPATNFVTDAAGFKTELENGTAGLTTTLQRAESAETDHSVATLYECPASDSYYLTVKNRVAGRDKDGKLVFKDTEFVEYISIAPEDAKALMAGNPLAAV